MYCAQCGTKLPDSASFCSNCGCRAYTHQKQYAAPQRKSKKLSFIAKFFIVIAILFAVFFCLVVGAAIDSDHGGNVAESKQKAEQNAVDNIIVNNESMTVAYIGAKDQDNLGVFYVILKIENKTETEIVINLESADVDGETIPLITTGVPLVIRPGNSGKTAFVFSMVNLSISSMDEAKKATFRVVARDNESYDVIFKSDLVTVDLH